VIHSVELIALECRYGNETGPITGLTRRVSSRYGAELGKLHRK
jgi:hypothetical protein